MKRLVGKRFVAGGKRLVPGDIVDVSGWRNLKVLESGGWLKPLPEEKPKAAPVQEPKVEADASPKPVKKAVKPADGLNEDK
jgi:hypothetical protein